MFPRKWPADTLTQTAQFGYAEEIRGANLRTFISHAMIHGKKSIREPSGTVTGRFAADNLSHDLLLYAPQHWHDSNAIFPSTDGSVADT